MASSSHTGHKSNIPPARQLKGNPKRSENDEPPPSPSSIRSDDTSVHSKNAELPVPTVVSSVKQFNEFQAQLQILLQQQAPVEDSADSLTEEDAMHEETVQKRKQARELEEAAMKAA